jgi:hypothetical protein
MRTDELLAEASRKRDLALQIQVQAESMARDSLRAVAIKQADKWTQRPTD